MKLEKMDSWGGIASFLLVVVAVIIGDIFCTEQTQFSRRAVPFNANETAWPELGRRNYAPNTPTWTFPSYTTTPWSEVGGRWQIGSTSAGRYYPPSPSPVWGRPKPTTPSPNVPQNPRQPPYFSGPINQHPQQTPNNQHAQPEMVYGTKDVNDEELRSFFETLLQRDENNAARFVNANYQGRTTSRSPNDEAPLPLLRINSQAYSIPTISKLKMLYDNYILESNVHEKVTNQERDEEDELINVVTSTPIMQMVHTFLTSKGKVSRDPGEFRNLIKEIWFTLYSRGGGKMGSSGFEHVFLAEIKNNGISGLHNWVYFAEQEDQNNANYLGYMKKIDLGDKGAILKYHFSLHNIDKPVGAMFIGTSPELEMALYSTCFLVRADKICPVRLNGHRFIIRTFTYRYRGKSLIGSAFPEI